MSWLLAVVAGLVAMEHYDQTPGRVGETPLQWPSGAAEPLDPTRATLLMFVHPKCPCSRASIGELNRLLAQCGNNLAPHVVFFAPADVSDDWSQTDLWKSVQAIPGVHAEVDTGGLLAQRFGGETSGYVVVYDPRGKLIFHGGITAERGHAGDNAGENAIVALLVDGSATIRRTPVFGCSLENPERAAPEPLCNQPPPQLLTRSRGAP